MIRHVAALEICTKIQYNAGMEREPVVDTGRIRDEMKRLSEKLSHEVKLPELADLAGVNYNTLSKAVTEENRRVSADLVARLALVFGCSIEFLMGVADERKPMVLNLGDVLDTLVTIAKTLPVIRQRDLLIMVRKVPSSYASALPVAKHTICIVDRRSSIDDARADRKLSLCYRWHLFTRKESNRSLLY